MDAFAQTFSFLTEQECRRLMAVGEIKRFNGEETIIAEGEPVDAIYVVVSGEVRVELSHLGGIVAVARFGPGELFGEMSYVEDDAASASVVADGETQIRCIVGQEIRRIAEQDPSFEGRFFRSLASVLSRRLRATTPRVVTSSTWG